MRLPAELRGGGHTHVGTTAEPGGTVVPERRCLLGLEWSCPIASWGSARIRKKTRGRTEQLAFPGYRYWGGGGPPTPLAKIDRDKH
eukprot:gene16170-biopygen20250